MSLKAIVLDIDGTLFTSKKVISKDTKEALITAQQHGLTVILASGRPTAGMFEIAKTLEMDRYEGYLVSYNGASITDCKTKELLFNQPIQTQTTQDILNHLKQFDVIPMINDDKFMYVNDVYKNTLQLDTGVFNVIEYESRGGNFQLCEIKDLATFATFPINKILVAANPDYLIEHVEDIRRPFTDMTTSAFSAPFYYEFTDNNIDKAKALDAIFPNMGIKPEEMIAFGDGQNDLSIIRYAGVGVAMGNAVDELKEAADDITLSNDEDGIAIALNKYFKF